MAPEEYRCMAAECLRIADGIAHPNYQMALIGMAQAWLRLAHQAERNLTTDLVYETPAQRPVRQQQLQQGQPGTNGNGA
jgi:hypothetical protein